MKEVSILLTIWPPVQEEWEKISSIVEKKFEVKKRQAFRYTGSDWVDFIIRLYKLCYEEYEHEDAKPNIPKMIPKAIYMKKFSQDINLLEVIVKNPDFQQYKNGNPYGLEEIKKIKDSIRLIYANIPRFSVIHSFDTPVRNQEVIDLFNKECVEI